jgi:broad specificity phosphatase PhoE
VLLYLVRHGQTAVNALREEHGRFDDPLDGTGMEQAVAVGRRFTGVPVDAVVSSPLVRARQTAAPIAVATGRTVTVDPDLLDRDYGPWTGHPKDEVVDRFGSIDAAPGIEPWPDFAARAVAAMSAVVRRHDAAVRLVVVSHDAINRAVLGAWAPPPGVTHPHEIPQANACWNRLRRGPDGWSLEVLDARPGDPRTP